MTTLRPTPSVEGPPRTGRKPLEAIWTRLVIDPVADRVVRLLLPRAWITPNRVTVLAGLLGLASAAAFLNGWLAVGGVLFQVRFLVDCLDGRLARLRGSATTWGAALDLLVDTVGVVLNFAALATWVVTAGRTGAAPDPLVAAVVASCGLYCWTLAHRKSLPGGGQHDWLAAGSTEAVPAEERPRSLVGRYVAAMARHGMVPTPYAVEVEAFALTLVPIGALVAGDRAGLVVAVGLWLATGFYVAATGLNVLRTWRLARALDAKGDVDR